MAWRVERGDCMSVLAKMDSSSVDHVICDPPYDAKTHANVMSMKGGSAGEVQLGFDALSTMAHVREMLRVAKRWVVCFCALEQLGEYKLYAGDSWVRAGFWDRINGTPQLTGDRPGQPGEGVAIMWAGNGRMEWNGGGRPALWRVPRASGDRLHPTEKPELLMVQMVRDFTDYGDTVIDPFCGSGTTGVAAVRLGRNFIGIEMLDKHAQTAINRLKQTHEQQELVFAKKRKPKQSKLFTEAKDAKAEDGQEERKGSAEVVEAGDGLADHRPCVEVDEGQVAPAGGQVGPVDGGDRVVADRQGEAVSEGGSEGDPFGPSEDGDEGPEVLGEDSQEFGALESEDDEAGGIDRGW